MSDSNLSNKQIIERWLQDYARSSRYTYTYSYEFLMETLGGKALVDLTVEDIQKTQAEIYKSSQELQQLEPKKAFSLLRLRSIGIRSLLKFLYDDDIHDEDLSGLITVEHPRGKKEERADRQVIFQLVEMMALTGLSRKQQVLFWLVAFVRLPIDRIMELTWSDFDMAENIIRLTGKNNEVTQVTIASKIWVQLLELKPPGGYLFDSVFEYDDRRAIDKALKAIGLKSGVKSLGKRNPKLILVPVYSLFS